MPEGYTRDPGMPLVFGSQGSDWWPAAVCSGHRLLGGGGADSPSPNPGWAVKWERRGNKEKKKKKEKEGDPAPNRGGSPSPLPPWVEPGDLSLRDG